MRGRTLSDAFIILDEAQNTTPQQMKMFLTRFGMRSRMVICGDPNQTDLPRGSESGLPTRSQARGHSAARDGALQRRRRRPPSARRADRRGL
jgi:phosphate starvation-inducible protein PhoH